MDSVNTEPSSDDRFIFASLCVRVKSKNTKLRRKCEGIYFFYRPEIKHLDSLKYLLNYMSIKQLKILTAQLGTG